MSHRVIFITNVHKNVTAFQQCKVSRSQNPEKQNNYIPAHVVTITAELYRKKNTENPHHAEFIYSA